MNVKTNKDDIDTTIEEDEILEDDLDENLSEDDDDMEIEDEEGGDDDDDEDEDDDDDDEEGGKKKDKKKDTKKTKKSSAVVQKQKYRKKYKEALATIKELKGKEKAGTLTDEEKKELDATNYLRDTIRDVLKEEKEDTEKSKAEKEEEFQDALEDAMENNPKIKEEDIIDACKEYGVAPDKAVKIIKKLAGKVKKKPKTPNPKRGSTKVKTEKNKDGDKPKTIDDVNRDVKKDIRDGKFED